MVLYNGLFSNMVLQRNSRNESAAKFDGTCSCSGSVIARVSRGAKVLDDLESVKVGKAAGRTFRGKLSGIPVGGPYKIEISIVAGNGAVLDKMVIRNVLVGDVWILAGQSNMEGIGRIADRAAPHKMVRAFYMDDHWDTAGDPLHELHKAADSVHAQLSGGVAEPRPAYIGTGPGVAFGKELYKKSGVPQGLIACAHGGTSMTQWDPALRKHGGDSLYGAMMRRFRKNGGAVSGVFWYQGCSETHEPSSALYTERMETLVDAVREDTSRRLLPWVVVQISRVCGSDPAARWWNSIRERQRQLPQHIRKLTVVPTIDLDLDDGIHISGASQNTLGVRCAHAMLSLVSRQMLPPIALKKVTTGIDSDSNTAVVTATFSNVAGSLTSPGRPSGFEISQEIDRLSDHYIFQTVCHRDSVVLKTSLDVLGINMSSLYYGFGTQPYCNITDEDGRSLPAFGPWFLGTRALSPFIRHFDASRLVPLTGTIDTLTYPADAASLELKPREFAGFFAERHSEIAEAAPDTFVLYYRTRIRCSEPMELTALLGYDGPVTLWLNRKRLHCDPGGTNPITTDKAAVPMKLKRGEHEIMVALSTDEGKAWGITLCFERTGVPKDLVSQGPGSFAIPEVIH